LFPYPKLLNKSAIRLRISRISNIKIQNKRCVKLTEKTPGAKISAFYLPRERLKAWYKFRVTDGFLLISYEIWGEYWFRVGKNVFFIADFQVLGIFIPKKHDSGKIKFPPVTRRCKTEFVPRLQPPA
jgi:hypothetical protein